MALALVAAGCGASPSTDRAVGTTATYGPTLTTPGSAPGAACPSTARVPVDGEVRTIDVGGTERRYVLSVPEDFDGTQTVALVFDFYGRQGDAVEQVADFELDDRATAAGMVVVTLQADDDRDPALNAWATDVPVVAQILDSLRSTWCIDPDAVYAAGFSDGGVFSAYLACRLPGVFAAVATVAEVGFPEGCPGGADAFSIIGFHGRSDPVVPYDGGATDDGDGRSGLLPGTGDLPPSLAVEDTFAAFAEQDGCAGPPSRTPAAPGVERLAHAGCRPGLAVELYSVAAGGHEIPGDPGPDDPAPDSIDANRLIVEFFAAHPRAGS